MPLPGEKEGDNCPLSSSMTGGDGGAGSPPLIRAGAFNAPSGFMSNLNLHDWCGSDHVQVIVPAS